MAEQGGVLGPYLEAVKRYRVDEVGDVRQQSNSEGSEPSPMAEPEPTDGGQTSGGTPTDDARLKILSILAERDELSLVELQTSAGLSFTDFGPVLTALQRAGLVQVDGEPGKEECRLTEQGRALISFQAS
jgi:predicted transcriptional regulator